MDHGSEIILNSIEIEKTNLNESILDSLLRIAIEGLPLESYLWASIR